MQTVESRPEIIVTPAAVLFAAETGLLDAERMIERELDRIFCEEWGPGWNFSRDDQRIDVFGAADLPDYVEALLELGFSLVRIHAHGTATLSCSCATHWSRH